MLAASIHIASPDGGDSKAAVSPRSSGFHFLSPLRHVVGAVRRLTARLQGDSDDEDLGERANLYAGDVIEGEGGLHDVRFKIAKKLGEGRFSSVFSAESMLVRGAGGNNGNGGGNGTNGGPSNLGPARACSPSNTNGGSTSTLLSIPGEAEAKKRVRDQKASSSSANGELQLYPIDDHVIHESIPPVVAVKALRSQASLDEMQGEISVLRSCHGCPYIIDFYGFAHFHFMGTDPHKCLLLELAHSDLHSMVQKGLTVQNKNVIRQIGPQMHDALLFLKKNSYVHLDLKPENVVVMPPRHWNAMDRKAAVSGKKKMQLGISNSERGGDDDVYFQVKISDLGSVEIVTKTPKKVVDEGICVTRPYRAPELLMWSTTGGADNANGATARLSSSAAPNGRGKNRKGASSSSAHQTGDYHFYTDWFSLGLILHECWTGNLSVDLDALGYAPNEGEDPERADPEKACDEAHLKLLSQELPNISKDLEKIAPGLSILVSDAKNRTKRVVEDVDGGKIQWGKEYVAIVRRQKKNHLALENLQSEETKLLHQLEGIRSKRRKILDEMEG